MQVVERLRAEGWEDYIHDGISIGGGFSFSPSPYTSLGTIQVTIKGNTVTKIDGSLLFYFPIGDLMEQFGTPEGLYVVSEGGYTCTSCKEWKPPAELERSSPVRLLYPEQGLRFLIMVPESGLGCICPEMEVAGFDYYAPSSMQEALDELNQERAGLYPGAGLPEITLGDIAEWHGFGGGY